MATAFSGDGRGSQRGHAGVHGGGRRESCEEACERRRHVQRKEFISLSIFVRTWGSWAYVVPGTRVDRWTQGLGSFQPPGDAQRLP